ncbi:hypothetical protein H1R20_g2303, partial [Candolleomyces eurysporus]
MEPYIVFTVGGDMSWTERSSKTCSLKQIPNGIILRKIWREQIHSRGLTQTETYVNHLQFSLAFCILTACPFACEHVQIAIEHLGISYQDFIVPICPTCLSEGHRNSIHKPEVVFFGESIKQEVKQRSYHDIESSDQLLVVGTTLATYSAFRLVKHALDLKKPVILLNLGPTRADLLSNIEKINMASGTILVDVARLVIGRENQADPVLLNMLQSGVVNPPLPDDDRVPRAAG